MKKRKLSPNNLVFNSLNNDSKNQIIEKRCKTYQVNNETNINYKPGQTLNITFETPDNLFIDPLQSSINFELKLFNLYPELDDFDPLTDAYNEHQSAIIRHIMDLFKSIKIYHENNTLLYEDNFFNHHWLHDVISVSTPDQFSKIQNLGHGLLIEDGVEIIKHPTNNFCFINSNTYKPTLRHFPYINDINDLDDDIVNNMFYTINYLSSSIHSKNNTISKFCEFKKSTIGLNPINNNPVSIYFAIPLIWIPFFNCESGALVPPEIHKNLRIELELEKEYFFMRSSLIGVLQKQNRLNYEIENVKIDICEILFPHNVIKIVSKKSKSKGIKWYFDATKTLFKNYCLNDVRLIYQNPLSSVKKLSAIPKSAYAYEQPLINPDFDVYDPATNKYNNEYDDITKRQNSVFFNSLNSDCDKLNVDNISSINHDVLFKEWQFTIGSKKYPYDKVVEKKNSISKTYLEYVKSTDYVNSGNTLNFEEFNTGFCYHVVQNIERDPTLLNTGVQSDRDHEIMFNATFHNSETANFRKNVHFFITHLREIIFVDNKIVVKD